MSAPALEALAAAKAAGARLSLNGDFIRWQARGGLPSNVIDLLKSAKPDLLRILAGREAAGAASEAEPPPDCPPDRWAESQRGLRRFVADGWADQAALLAWTIEELYRVPPVWGRVDLTGAALMIGDRRVVAVTEASIAIETLSGSRLKFRRIGRGHLA